MHVGKTSTDLQIVGCGLHQNAFGGRAPPGPAGGAIALPRVGMTNYHIGPHWATLDHIGLRGTTSEHIGQHWTTWERIEPLRTMPSAENCWYSSCVIEAQTRWARLLHAEHSIVSDMQRLSQKTHGKTVRLYRELPISACLGCRELL